MLRHSISRISFVGLGLIGTALLLALKRAAQASGKRIEFIGYDPGLGRDDIDCITGTYGLDRFEPDPDKHYDADLIVLAAPVRTNIALLDEIRRHAPAGVVVTDVSSTKSLIAVKASELGIPFIGMHPIAGREQQGFRAASADLLAGRLMVICADARLLASGIGREFLALVESCGCVPAFMTPEEHDRVFANISHLPQLISTALITFCSDHIGSSGPGFASATRLAGSAWQIWRDIIATNSENISRELDSFAGTLKQLAQDIKEQKLDTLEATFSKANSLYQTLQEKNRL